MAEVWKAVPGWEGLYEVSDQGRVRSLPRPHRVRGGGTAIRAGRIMKPGTGTGGHLLVTLSLNGTSRTVPVHRLVLEAFVGPCPDGLVCRHLNGVPNDNRPENLSWGTVSENMYDRVRHGTHHWAKEDLCIHGHPKDGVIFRPDGALQQRYCRTCHARWQRERRLRRTICKKGHPLDGVRHKADGSVYQRFCKTCVNEQMQGGRGLRAQLTHCKYGHPLDGKTARQRYCKTCKRDQEKRRRNQAA